MNPWLLAGSLLVLGAAAAHALLGEKVILPRLFRHAGDPDLGHRRAADDPATRQSVRLAWHSLTIALLGYAMLLLTASLDGDAFGGAWRETVLLLAGVLAGLALLALVMTRGRHIGWMWFAVAAAAVWIAAE